MSEPLARLSRSSAVGEPTLGQVMRSPKWLAALVFALLVAAGFAWLGSWQLSHAITLEAGQGVDTERAVPLSQITSPGEVMTDESAGRVVAVTGSLLAGDFAVVEQRVNGGEIGAWIVGHLLLHGEGAGEGAGAGEGEGHLAVALAWAPDRVTADRALSQLERRLAGVEFSAVGRYMPGDAPLRPADGVPLTQLQSMAPGQLVNLWQPFSGRAYAGYLVVHPADTAAPAAFVDPGHPDNLADPAAVDSVAARSAEAAVPLAAILAELGLAAIDSVPPLPVETINWLNLFYAAEWVVFAGFAVFFWCRLVRDDWEKTHELRAMLAEQGGAEEQ